MMFYNWTTQVVVMGMVDDVFGEIVVAWNWKIQKSWAIQQLTKSGGCNIINDWWFQRVYPLVNLVNVYIAMENHNL
jgi:hypothetical protein